MSQLQAITIWQPWATLIAEGCKRWEFRRWAAPKRLHGQRVAIHAGARKVSVTEVRALMVNLHSSHWRETGLCRELALELLEKVRQNPAGLPLSAIVCTAVLGPPIRDVELAAQLGLPALNDSDRDHSNWGWPLSEVERLWPPVPATGRQGWWPVSL